MTISDKIQFAGILVSLVLGTASIVIAVSSLRQGTRMIEDSSRPYISIYLSRINVKSPETYIVIKNFGSSAALIEKLDTDVDLRKTHSFYKDKQHPPFSNFVGTTFAPGQSILTLIDVHEALGEFDTITFDLSYSYDSKTYSETIVLELKSGWGTMSLSRSDIKDNETSVIAASSLYELLKKSL